MDNCCGNDIGSVFCVIGIEVRSMLEIVSIDFACGKGFIRKNIVGEFYDFKGPAVCCKNFFCNFKNFCMRSRGSTNFDNFFIRLGRACCKAEGKDNCEYKSDDLFHNFSPFIGYLFLLSIFFAAISNAI